MTLVYKNEINIGINMEKSLDNIDLQLLEAKNKFSKFFRLYTSIIFAILVITIIPVFFWKSYIIIFMIIMLINVMIIVIYFVFLGMCLGFNKRCEIYNAILQTEPTAQITKIKKSIFVEYIIFKTDGRKYPENMKVEFLMGSQYSNQHFRVTTDHYSPYGFYISRIGDKTIFETDNENMLKFKDDVKYLTNQDVIHNINNEMIGESNEQNNDKKLERLLNLIKRMSKIQKVNKENGIPISRDNAPDTFSYLFGPQKYTVCLACENIVGKWKSKDRINVHKCPSCGSSTVILLASSKKELIEKIEKIKMS